MTEKQLIADIQAGKFAPVYLITGEENYYIDKVSDYFEEHVIDESVRDFDLSIMYGRDVDMLTVINTAMRYPLMSPIHLVIVKEAQDIDIKQWEKSLEPYLANPQQQSVIVFCYRHKKIDKRKSVYKAIDKVGVVYETPKVYDNQVPAWIANEVAQHGMKIGDKANRSVLISVKWPTNCRNSIHYYPKEARLQKNSSKTKLALAKIIMYSSCKMPLAAATL